ncbi:MAG TPA: hypothetical protein DCR93_31940 [Cytophagales bacterium]|nr:hypothetical protein [Cytophagales bacterium]
MILLLSAALLLLAGCEKPSSSPQVTESPLPEVLAVYPSADTLPENLLRMYVEFATPMKTTGNLSRIQLKDAQGQVLNGVLFDNVYELWDPDQRQLTLLFDPGRVKTGLQAHDALGRALTPGATYQLQVAGLEDIYHQSLTEPFIKSFVAGPPDTVAPNFEHWQIAAPHSQTQNPLRVTFPGTVDRMSLLHRLVVCDTALQPILGTVSVQQHETVWQFVPDSPWPSGTYTLNVNTRLEDPAGNNLNGLFDHPTGSLRYAQEGETVSIPFTVGTVEAGKW